MEKQAYTSIASRHRGATARGVFYGVSATIILLGAAAIIIAIHGHANAVSMMLTNVEDLNQPHSATHKTPTATQNAEINAVLIYSGTCSHCHALINHLKSKNAFKELNIIETTDPSPYIPLLNKMGISFDGVPTFIIYLPDKNLPSEISTVPYVVIVGFPADSQNKDGYIMGKDMELSYCRGMHGVPHYENNTYLFCIRKDGAIIGNEHAVDWILKMIESET